MGCGCGGGKKQWPGDDPVKAAAQAGGSGRDAWDQKPVFTWPAAANGPAPKQA